MVNRINSNDKEIIEFNVADKDLPILMRHFSKFTKRDLEIKELPVPKNPLWLKITIQMIKLYQDNVSHKLGNRCVFDPSCSHYAIIAFREKGFAGGMLQTLSRLRRCNKNNGGIDELI